MLAKIIAFFGYFKPSYLKKQWNSLVQKTWFELIYGSVKIIFKGIYLSGWSVYYVNRVTMRIMLKLMLGEYGYKEEEEEPAEKQPTLPYAAMIDVAPRMALMSAEEVESSRAAQIDPTQADEGIVEDMSECAFLSCHCRR